MHNKGFTLFELLVVIAIIGTLATVIVPTFMRRSPIYERRAVIAKLNALTRLAWQNALIENKIHKVKFNLEEGEVSLEITKGQYEKGEPTFKPLERTYIDTHFDWPENLEIKQFFLEKTDEIRLRGGRTDLSLWFFVMPDGLAQDVIINFIDTKDLLPDGRPKPFGLVLNPFSVQFKEYDTFQK